MTEGELNALLADYEAGRISEKETLQKLLDGGVHEGLAREMIYISSGGDDVIGMPPERERPE